MPEGVGYGENIVGAQHSQSPISPDEHAFIVQAFEDAEEAGHDARKLMERDRDYYDNKQLTEEEVAELRRRGQPAIIINRIAPKVDFLLGLESQQRTDPRGFPRNPQDEEGAEACTDGLRYVKDAEDLDQTFSSTWEDMIIPGFCAAEVNIKETRRGTEVWVEYHEWDYSFYDPHSRRHDFEDARYLGVVKWMDVSAAEQQWPEKAAEIQGVFADDAIEGWDDFEDKPASAIWVQGGSRKRLRVVQICWRQGSQWKWAIYTKGVVFVGGDVPFVDQDGLSECPLIFQSAYVDRENNRYGAVRKLIGPQDEINARRSKLLHMLNVNQTWSQEGVVDDEDEMKRQLARADGHVKANGRFGEEWGVVDKSQQINGQAELLQEAKGEIEAIGANNALQGRAGEASSGRAILASQQGGMVEIAKLTDRHRHFKNRVYRAIWNRIRQYWSEEKWIRVTDDENNVKFVGFNRTMTKAEKLIEDAEKEGMPKEEAEQRLEQAIQQNPAIVPDLQSQVQVNVAADMDMDINVEEVPDVVSVQQEQFDELSKLLQSGIPLEDPRMKLLISASSLRDKGKLLEQIEGNQAPTPEQQEAAQLQKRGAEAEITGRELANKETEAKIAKTYADIQNGNTAEPIDPEKNDLDKEEQRARIEKTRADGIKSLAQADAQDGVIGNLPAQQQQSAA